MTTAAPRCSSNAPQSAHYPRLSSSSRPSSASVARSPLRHFAPIKSSVAAVAAADAEVPQQLQQRNRPSSAGTVASTSRERRYTAAVFLASADAQRKTVTGVLRVRGSGPGRADAVVYDSLLQTQLEELKWRCNTLQEEAVKRDHLINNDLQHTVSANISKELQRLLKREGERVAALERQYNHLTQQQQQKQNRLQSLQRSLQQQQQQQQQYRQTDTTEMEHLSMLEHQHNEVQEDLAVLIEYGLTLQHMRRTKLDANTKSHKGFHEMRRRLAGLGQRCDELLLLAQDLHCERLSARAELSSSNKVAEKERAVREALMQERQALLQRQQQQQQQQQRQQKKTSRMQQTSIRRSGATMRSSWLVAQVASQAALEKVDTLQQAAERIRIVTGCSDLEDAANRLAAFNTAEPSLQAVQTETQLKLTQLQREKQKLQDEMHVTMVGDMAINGDASTGIMRASNQYLSLSEQLQHSLLFVQSWQHKCQEMHTLGMRCHIGFQHLLNLIAAQLQTDHAQLTVTGTTVDILAMLEAQLEFLVVGVEAPVDLAEGNVTLVAATDDPITVVSIHNIRIQLSHHPNDNDALLDASPNSSGDDDDDEDSTQTSFATERQQLHQDWMVKHRPSAQPQPPTKPKTRPKRLSSTHIRQPQSHAAQRQ